MSSALFNIQEHTVPCQHIREYARATADKQEDVLHLAVKQYTPLDNVSPRPGDVSIIGGHANGFPKELYEPLWDEILLRSKSLGFRIRGIWIADVSHQGMSYVLNENKLGDDPSWDDHPRDLLHLINYFRHQMPRPLIGIGHSMGGCQLTNLALLHPRLLASLVLLDPVIQQHILPSMGQGVSPAVASTFRRDLWPSRRAAAESFRKSKFYQAWDERVLDRWLQYGLRDVPTAIYPNDLATADGEKPVTLTTTKHQEVFTFLRPTFGGKHEPEKDIVDGVIHAELDPSFPNSYPFYRPEPVRTFHNLPFVRPSVLYILGGLSHLSPPEWRKEKLELTGSGIGGSGGVKKGRVKEVVLEEHGHLIAMEAVEACADATAAWLETELKRWREEDDRSMQEWSQTSKRDKLVVSEEWKKQVVQGSPARKEKL